MTRSENDEGWVDYFHDYASRANFREWWKRWMGGYDIEFTRYFQETHLPKEFWIQIQKTESPKGPGDHHVKE